jgi:hypothetical protein
MKRRERKKEICRVCGWKSLWCLVLIVLCNFSSFYCSNINFVVVVFVLIFVTPWIHKYKFSITTNLLIISSLFYHRSSISCTRWLKITCSGMCCSWSSVTSIYFVNSYNIHRYATTCLMCSRWAKKFFYILFCIYFSKGTRNEEMWISCLHKLSHHHMNMKKKTLILVCAVIELIKFYIFNPQHMFIAFANSS